MKNCAYCGRENDDNAPHCAGCGMSEFVLANSVSAVPKEEKREAPEEEVIVRDHPKLIVVAGIWLIYGSGLLGNIVVLIAVLTGTIRGIRGFFYFGFSLGCGALCVYLMRRAVKNYNIRKKRAADESVV